MAQCVSCVKASEAAVCMQAQDVNDAHASPLLQSVPTSEAAFMSSRKADAPAAGSASEAPATLPQDGSDGEGAGPQAAAPVPTFTSESTAPVPSDMADSTSANPSTASPPTPPADQSGSPPFSKTGPFVPTLLTSVSPLAANPVSALASNRSILQAAASHSGCAPNPACQDGEMAEANPPGADQAITESSGQADISSPQPPHVQADSVAQSSKDGEGAYPKATGMCDAQPPVLAGEAAAAPPAQPATHSSWVLSPSTTAQPSCLVTAPRPESSTRLHTSTSVTLDARSCTVNPTDEGNVAAGSACGPEQQQAETATDDLSLQPAQKLHASPPVAPVPAALTADQQDWSLNGDAMADGWGEAAPPVAPVSTHAVKQPVPVWSSFPSSSSLQHARGVLDGSSSHQPARSAMPKQNISGESVQDSSRHGKRNRHRTKRAKVRLIAQLVVTTMA